MPSPGEDRFLCKISCFYFLGMSFFSLYLGHLGSDPLKSSQDRPPQAQFAHSAHAQADVLSELIPLLDKMQSE